MNDLALQIRLIHVVSIDDADGTDSGGRKIQESRRTQSSGADTQYARILQPLLAVDADIRDDEVPAVPAHLIAGQRYLRRCRDQGFSHDCSPPAKARDVVYE